MARIIRYQRFGAPERSWPNLILKLKKSHMRAYVILKIRSQNKEYLVAQLM